MNWSPPNADTQGLIPPVPTAIVVRANAVKPLLLHITMILNGDQ